MAVLEDIVGVVVIIIIALVASILLITNLSKSKSEEGYDVQEKIEMKYSNSFNALLSVTEQRLSRSFGDLLGSAVYFRNRQIKKNEITIDIQEEFRKLLDTTFKNYYFEVIPAVSSIEMIFVIPGIDSLYDEIEDLSKNKDDIIKQAKKISNNARLKVYIISNYSSGLCDQFGSNCYYLDYKNFYANGSSDLDDLKKQKYNLTKPKNFGDSMEIWQSDWETALSYLIITIDNTNLGNYRIFFPTVDKLPTATKYFYPCPSEYADGILLRDQQIIDRFNFIVDPIFSINPDPIIYCDDKVLTQLNGLIVNNVGKVFLNKDNFIENIPNIIKGNIEDVKIKIGDKKFGKSFVIERKLMLPNGELAIARLYLY